MNIALSFIGISSFLGRDYNHCFNSINNNLIKPFLSNNNIKIYTTTYNDKENKLILDLYKPYKSLFLDYENSHQVLTYKNGINLIEECDFIISTRFDIHFHQNMNNIGIIFNKFNTLFKEKGWWDNMHFTTDNFFAFPYYMKNDFISVLDSLYLNPSRQNQTDLHQAFYRMQNIIGDTNTHIISNKDELSNYNSYYNLCNTKWGISK